MAFKVYTGSNQTIGGIKTFSSFIAADAGISMGASIDMNGNDISELNIIAGPQGYIDLDNSTYGVWINSSGSATDNQIVLSATDGIFFNSAMANAIDMAELSILNVKILDGDYGQINLDYNAGGIGALIVANTSGYLYLDGPSGIFFAGDLNFGGNQMTNYGSTTKVTNLNADFIDGIHLTGNKTASVGDLNDDSAWTVTYTHSLGTTNYFASVIPDSDTFSTITGGGTAQSWSCGIDQSNTNDLKIQLVNETGSTLVAVKFHVVIFYS